MKDRLFNEFPEVTAEQWKKQILSDLKGPDQYDQLIYKSADGVEVQPFYYSGDVQEKLEIPVSNSWNICEKILVDSAEEGNQKAKYATEKGAEAIWFVVLSNEISPEVLLGGLDLEQIPVFLQPNFLSEKYISRIGEYLQNKKHSVSLQIDILGNLGRTGEWYFNMDRDHEQLNAILNTSEVYESIISVDSGLFQNAGANIPQQLGFALAQMNEYLNFISEKGLDSTSLKPQFTIASGPNYFFEIAKIRALRWLYSSLAGEYGFNKTCHILAEPTRRDKTLYDYNVNLLRTTTQCMSAILGGADTVSNIAYDSIFHKANEFGDRISRNQLLVMKYEAYLDKVVNPAEGSYYIESLTTQFAQAGMEIFKEIENSGGFLQQLKEGKIQEEIRKSAAIEQEKFDKGELILIGTNKFMNPQDKISNELEVCPFHKEFDKPQFEPIIPVRLSEKIELERIAKEAV